MFKLPKLPNLLAPRNLGVLIAFVLVHIALAVGARLLKRNVAQVARLPVVSQVVDQLDRNYDRLLESSVYVAVLVSAVLFAKKNKYVAIEC